MYVPKDRVTNLHQGYGFVEFRSEEDADYVSHRVPPMTIVSIGFIFVKIVFIFGANFLCCLFLAFVFVGMITQAIKVLNMIKLYGKPIRVNKVLGIDFLTMSSRSCVMYVMNAFVALLYQKCEMLLTGKRLHFVGLNITKQL